MAWMCGGASVCGDAAFAAAQRQALTLPNVGFAVTTDIQRALHPTDKTPVAARLLLEMLRISYGRDVVSRGPELVSAVLPSNDRNTLLLTFSNTSSDMSAHIGLHVNGTACRNSYKSHKTPWDCQIVGPFTMGVTDYNETLGEATPLPFNFTQNGAVQVQLNASDPRQLVHFNDALASIFLYGPTGLPAPSLLVNISTL